MLESYEGKRDFNATPEPPPGDGGPRRGALRFVVQEHAARRLHYDFRLEADGVLTSWPVPRGPSLDPDEKRLAVMVEDHPTDYGTFEGVIPKGEYGAGQVIVWDAGVYSPDEGGLVPFGDREAAEAQMRKGLADGKLSFTLHGRKLRGSWTLVRTTSRGPNEWLLIKHNDADADPSRDILEEDRSVLVGADHRRPQGRAAARPWPRRPLRRRRRPGGAVPHILEADDGPHRGGRFHPP